MPDIKTIEDAAREISRLKILVDTLLNRDINLHGRRIINAGDSVNETDYVTRRELNAAIEE